MNRRRFQRLATALARRQPDLTVLLENVHKPHNLAAVVRSCDAVGVLGAHAVYPEGELTLRQLAAAGTRRWVEVSGHPDLPTALGELAGRGMQLLAAHPGPHSEDFREVDYTRPTAVLLGQEKDGLSAPALAAADRTISIPMMGLGASLNVSVAAALILFEAQRQRRAAGLYDECALAPEVFQRKLFEWAYPRLAARCRRMQCLYPPLGPEGELLGEVPR